MNIDPQLRTEPPPGAPYHSQPHRLASSNAPPSLMPNPSNLLPHHQYRNETTRQSVYPARPQSAGDSDQPSNEHGGTEEDGSTNDPKRPRACEACRGLKVRCELDLNNPSGPCKRCAKANRNCIVTAPSRKRQKKTDSRVAELEKKIDALTASLHASKSTPATTSQSSPQKSDREPSSVGTRPNQYEQVTNGSYGYFFENKAGSDSWTPTERSTKQSEGDVKPPMVIAGQKRKYQEGRDNTLSAAGSTSATHPDLVPLPATVHPAVCKADEALPTRLNTSHQYADVVDRGIVTMEKATRMFDRYVNEMARHLPAVVFPLGTTAADIRKTKPILFMAILCVGSGADYPELQRTLTKEIMQIYAERIVCNGEKSLELVQALLVSTIWYWPPDHVEELKFYQLIHIAAVMALDIGIHKKTKGSKSRFGLGLWRDKSWRRTPFPDADTIEAKRAWLGCYFMCCVASMGLRRPNLIRWSFYMEECIEVLETSTDAAPTDNFLAQCIQSQRIAEGVGIHFAMDDPSATINIADPKIQYALKGFERDLEHWVQQVPKEVRAPTLTMFEHTVNLYMHEVAMHVDHNIEEFKPPFTEEGLRGSAMAAQDDSTPLTASHIAALSTCLTSIDSIFEAFLSMEIEVIRTLPVLYFVRVAYSIVVLVKMYFAAAKPNSELGKVINKDNMKVEGYLDSLLDKFRVTSAQSKSRPASKFMMILVMLKTWLNRSKTGKFCSTGPHLEQDIPGQTFGPLGTQHQPKCEYSPANTPLQLLSEVATGSSSRPESRNQYASSNWQASQQVQQPQEQIPAQMLQQASHAPPPPFNFAEVGSSNAMLPGYGVGYGAVNGMEPGIGLEGDFDFNIGDGFEQAMGMALGDGEFAKYFQDDGLWNAVMEGTGNAFDQW